MNSLRTKFPPTLIGKKVKLTLDDGTTVTDVCQYIDYDEDDGCVIFEYDSYALDYIKKIEEVK